jgi:predicted metal-dependent phosphoesterase TrpH
MPGYYGDSHREKNTVGMIIDLHTHEELYSPCSSMSLKDAVDSARYHGLDGICITDHDSMEIQKTAAAYLGQVGFPVFIGVEVTTMHGDFVAFGLNSLPEIRPLYCLPAQDFIDHVSAQNGFCFAAHPFRYGEGEGRYLNFLHGLHGVEIYNGGNTANSNTKAAALCRKLNLIPVAGSDAHDVDDVGMYATYFPDRIETIDSLVQSLKSGKCRPVTRKTSFNDTSVATWRVLPVS